MKPGLLSKQSRSSFFLVLLMTVCLPSLASAQFPSTLSSRGGFQPSQPLANPFGPPTTSPYLNLLRGGSTVGNYYGLVRPEISFRAADRQLQQAYQFNRAPVSRDDLPSNSIDGRTSYGQGASRVPQTGHGAGFMSDLRGQYQTFNQTVINRRRSVMQRAGTSSFRLPSSGHTTFFGNSYQFYQR